MRRHIHQSTRKLQGSLVLSKVGMRTNRLDRAKIEPMRVLGLTVSWPRGRVIYMHSSERLRLANRALSVADVVSEFVSQSNHELAS